MPTPATSRSAPGRFLDPVVLARIGNLDLVSRRVVDGFMSGLHQAVNLGSSTDFAEYRAYTPGDDIRRIDWRVYGRTDRLYIKTFEAETNADVIVALDCSGSMQFASASVEKFDYARMLGASLIHLGARQRDRVGYVSFTDSIVERIPPAGRHRDRIIRSMSAQKPTEASDFPAAITQLAERLTRRGIVIVISDFYCTPEAAGNALEQLAARGHDVVAFHVLDPMEHRLAVDESRLLEDAETGLRLPVTSASGDEYARIMDEHIAALSQRLTSRRVDYVNCVTDQPLDSALFAYLSSRARLARTRG